MLLDVLEEVRQLRRRASGLRRRPYTDREILPLLDDLLALAGGFFPRANKRPGNNKWIYNFGRREFDQIMVEPVHKGRNAIPRHWRTAQIRAVHQVLDVIEAWIEEA